MAEQQVLQAELSFLNSLELADAEEESARRKGPAPGIFAAAWERVLAWMAGRTTGINARLVQLTEQDLALGQELHKLSVAAQELDLGSVGQQVTRVVARLKGAPGKHKITVSYLVPTVRWVPSYDLRYDPARRQVEAVYYALVNQASGEDWDKAQLRFSTDMPRRLMAIPELPAWTLGRKRDFDPRPTRQVEPAPRLWRPSPVAATPDPVVGWAREALDRAQGYPPRGGRGDISQLLEGAVLGGADYRSKREEHRPSKPRSMPAPRMAPMDKEMDVAASEAPPPPSEPEPVMADEGMAERVSMPSMSTRRAQAKGGFALGDRSRTRPTESLPWGADGYRPPYIDPDLPAAAARGYRFTLYAPGAHTVPSTGQARRVPLMSQTFPVEPVYRITPGRAPWAYLMASVKNGTGRPILRGKAHLFAGAMFRGKSWLNTALPGHTIDLPLGVDDAVKVASHQTQKTVVQGVVFKDDVTEYTVTVEIANNHAYPIKVELHDQVPLKQGEKVEIKGVTSSPDMGKPDDQGRMRWKGSVPAREVKKVKFTFQIVRPRDWELRQHNG